MVNMLKPTAPGICARGENGKQLGALKTTSWKAREGEYLPTYQNPRTDLWIYQSTDQAINLAMYQFSYLSTYQPINLSIYRSINLTIDQSIDLSIYQFYNQSVCRSINLSIYQSADLSRYQSINLTDLPTKLPAGEFSNLPH